MLEIKGKEKITPEGKRTLTFKEARSTDGDTDRNRA